MEDEITEKNFALTPSNTERFAQSDFERRKCKPHISRLRRSIMEHGLLNKDIWVWTNGNNKLMIFDGQHRFAAIQSLLTEGYKQSFSIRLKIIDAPDIYAARKIYAALNLYVRTITAMDVLKSFDSGESYPFFNSFDDICTHYGTNKTFTYINVLRAYEYAKSRNPHTTDKDKLEEIVRSIKRDEIERIKKFYGLFIDLHGENTTQWFCKSGVFRNTFRIYWERFPDILPFMQKFLKIIANDSFLEKNNDIRTRESIMQLYEYMDDKLIKKANIIAKKNKEETL